MNIAIEKNQTLLWRRKTSSINSCWLEDMRNKSLSIVHYQKVCISNHWKEDETQGDFFMQSTAGLNLPVFLLIDWLL